jgi:AAA domain/Homeodomain-like domain/DnaB-like helicase N terminal domain
LRQPTVAKGKQMRTTQKNIVDCVVLFEKSVLGCLVEFCSRGSAKELDGVIASGLAADQFTTSDHRGIFGAMSELREEGKIPDELSLIGKLDSRAIAQVCDFTRGVVPENLERYARDLREAWQHRHFSKQIEELANLTNPEDQLAGVDRMREMLLSRGDADNWRSIFHTWEEFENAPPLRFAIDGFLQESGVTLIGGLAGHGKTLLMLAMAKALLEESPLFGHEPFSVPSRAQRVLYLIPESSVGPFWSRLQLFRLQEHVRDDRLLVSTLSSRDPVSLSDPRMLTAAEGADVFLDTAVRFMEGSENDAQDTRPFVQTLFRLLHAGARSITGAHHAPKGFEGQNFMTLENILRGSGDIGAMLSTAWGVRQVDASRTSLYVQNVKPRDFQPCAPFILEGRPHLDNTGQFLMIHKPGEAGELSEHLFRRNKGGRPAVPEKSEKLAQVVEMRASGAGLRKIAKAVGVGKTTVDRWLSDYDASQKCPTAGQSRDDAEPDGETPN